MNWIICPVIDCFEDYTKPAITDFLAQTIEPATRVLVVNNGSTDETRNALETWADVEPRLLVWSHMPPLPSLSASWNRALEFVWACGGEHALVVNNDVRLAGHTYARLAEVLHELDALFVTAVGVREEQFDPDVEFAWSGHKGGPDFSCFLISRECHRKYRFDEGFVPAYSEDCSYHREMMLAGDGPRIFSVNIPYLHYGSRTVNRSPEAMRAFEKLSGVSRAHYLKCWGGPVNGERYTVKGDPSSAQDGVTNPDLQRKVAEGRSPLVCP